MKKLLPITTVLISLSLLTAFWLPVPEPECPPQPSDPVTQSLICLDDQF